MHTLLYRNDIFSISGVAPGSCSSSHVHDLANVLWSFGMYGRSPGTYWKGNDANCSYTSLAQGVQHAMHAMHKKAVLSVEIERALRPDLGTWPSKPVPHGPRKQGYC